MQGRQKTADRRQQIVEATLELLATEPLEGLSTRQIAKRLDVSQPALFRHFLSKEELLLAVIAHSRAQLEQAVTEVIAAPGPAEQLRLLARRLLGHVTQHPGLPRLLVSARSSAGGQGAGARRQLVSMQVSLATELFREGQRGGAFRADVPPRDAAVAFAGLIQGAVLQWQIAGRAYPLEAAPARMLDVLLEGMRPSGGDSAHAAPPAAAPPPASGLTHLDVRPILAGGTDPLESILSAIAATQSPGLVSLTVPFRPAPLIALLTRRGHQLQEELDGGLWTIDVLLGGARLEDLRALEAPGPLERVLTATAALDPGDAYLARLPQHPRLLLPHLERRELAFEILDEPGGSALLRVWRRS